MVPFQEGKFVNNSCFLGLILERMEMKEWNYWKITSGVIQILKLLNVSWSSNFPFFMLYSLILLKEPYFISRFTEHVPRPCIIAPFEAFGIRTSQVKISDWVVISQPNNSCQIGDTEFVVFLYGLSQIPQLKSVCLKVIQFDFFSTSFLIPIQENLLYQWITLKNL